MEFAAINSPATALVAGLVTSLHCAGMCGPLACSLMPIRGDRADAQTVSTIYHLSRLTSYALLGALAGGFGRVPLLWLSQSALRWLPWITVVFFIALALRWDRFIPRIPGFGRWIFQLQGWLWKRPRTQAAAALGFATPLLPCGPLYFLIALATLSGSALRGVEFMIAFGLGTVPLLWLAQSQFQWVRAKLSPLWLARTRTVLALTAAAVVGWRLRATLGFAGPDPASLICF
ncbi:MAG: sulfite exporter TauE/SafE family protein [Opitutaceae bacterium]|nr:sulfite exporter TauE/SafE family protein [Opitutaceae bacterium]